MFIFTFILFSLSFLPSLPSLFSVFFLAVSFRFRFVYYPNCSPCQGTLRQRILRTDGRKKSSLLQENSEKFPYYRKPSMFKHYCLKHAKQTLQGVFKNALSGIRPDVFIKHPFGDLPRVLTLWFKRTRLRQRPTTRLTVRTNCRD